MTDKTPKADRLREQREAKFNAEQVRQRADAMRMNETEKMAIKMRGTKQQRENFAAEQAMRQKLRNRK